MVTEKPLARSTHRQQRHCSAIFQFSWATLQGHGDREVHCKTYSFKVAMTKLLTVLNIFPRAAEISKLHFCDPDQHLTEIPHEQWTVVHLNLIQMSSFLVQLKFRIAIFSVILMTSHESPVEKWLEFKTTNYKCLG